MQKKEIQYANVYTTNPFSEQIEEYKSKSFKPERAIHDIFTKGLDGVGGIGVKNANSGKNELSKVARNLAMPMSVQVSRQNSLERLEPHNAKPVIGDAQNQEE